MGDRFNETWCLESESRVAKSVGLAFRDLPGRVWRAGGGLLESW